MISFIEGLVHLIPWLMMAGWIGFLLYNTEITHSKILAIKNHYDPRGEFVKDVGGMQFSRNRFRVDKKHHLCTQEFLSDWDDVYGAYWRRTILGLLLVPIVILIGRLVRFVLTTFLLNLF